MDKNSIKQKLLDDFNFDMLHSFMELMNWQWVGDGIPSINRMKEVASGLIDRALEKDDLTSTGTGGFMVTKTKEWNTEEFDTIKLSFIAFNSYAFLD